MSDAPRVDPQQATEIYRQRYETFRHLDRLRWQMFQIAIAAGSAIYVVDNRTGGPTRLAFLLAGIVLFILAAAMLRIGHGIKVNNTYLARAGTSLGDDGIPTSTGRVSTMIACAIAFAGAVSFIVGCAGG